MKNETHPPDDSYVFEVFEALHKLEHEPNKLTKKEISILKRLGHADELRKLGLIK